MEWGTFQGEFKAATENQASDRNDGVCPAIRMRCSWSERSLEHSEQVLTTQAADEGNIVVDYYSIRKYYPWSMTMSMKQSVRNQSRQIDGIQMSINEWVFLVDGWYSEHSEQPERLEQPSQSHLTAITTGQNVVKHFLQAFSNLMLDWTFNSNTNSGIQHAWEETRWWWSILVQLSTLQL